MNSHILSVNSHSTTIFIRDHLFFMNSWCLGGPLLYQYAFYSLSQIVSFFSLLLTSISKINMNPCLRFSHTESILTNTVPMILIFYIFKKLRKCSKRNDMNPSFHLFKTTVAIQNQAYILPIERIYLGSICLR